MKNKVLIVDDSLVFRRFIADIFEGSDEVQIVGEAQNGIEALELVLKTNPDVILLDLEMPLMDGMTALQHLMIHRPCPTIMFSSLTQEGTARCYDTIKNGAVDFICKDFIFQRNNISNHKKILVDKVIRAGRMVIKAREPVFSRSPKQIIVNDEEQRVIFCEECGQRQVITYRRTQPFHKVTCNQCGDTIDIEIGSQTQYRRNNFITVIGGGEGSLYNILEIIPQLGPQMGGCLIVVVHENTDYVNSFTEYLDAISELKVVRGREGLNLEGGHCYVVSGHDYMRIKPFSAHLTLERVPKNLINGGPVDVLFASVGTIYKKKASGVILSGENNDGDKGLAILMKNGGTPAVLNLNECLNRNMAQNAFEKCGLDKTSSTSEILEMVRKLHYGAKDDAVAG